MVSVKTKDTTANGTDQGITCGVNMDSWKVQLLALGTRYERDANEMREEVRGCLVQAALVAVSVAMNQVTSSRVRSDHRGRYESAKAFTCIVSTGHIVWNN